MATKPRRRMKYPPGAANVVYNPVNMAIDAARPLTSAAELVMKIKMANHSAMTELLAGRAVRRHLSDVVACYNTTRCLVLNGCGDEHYQVVLDAGDAIEAVAKRFAEHGRYVLTGPEINALNLLLELADAQIEIASIGELLRATARAKAEFYSGKCVRLPSKYVGKQPVNQASEA